jgi:hypothetical protein
MLPADENDAARHWKKQTPSIDLPFNRKDPGLTQISGPDDALAIIQNEAAGKPVPVYRQKTNGKLPDPIAETVKKIRKVTQRNVTSEQFFKSCKTPEDIVLHTLLFGEMKDSEKASNMLKLAKHLSDRQIAVEKQNMARVALEDRRVKNAIEIKQKLNKLQRAQDSLEGELISKKAGDPQ